MDNVAGYALAGIIGAAIGGLVMWLLDFRILRGAMRDFYALGIRHGRERAQLGIAAPEDDEGEPHGCRAFAIRGATPAIRARIGAGVWTHYIADTGEESAKVWQ